jgi:hypothetical protein
MGEIRNAYKILIEKHEGKRALRRSRCRWENSMRMILREIGCEGVDLMHLAHDRFQWRDLVKMVMNIRVS